jgi:hypothetical protein
MELYYQQERNNDFFSVCERIRKETKGYVSVEKIAIQAVYNKAELFYLPAREIAKIIRGKKFDQNTKSPAKAELYKELKRRYELLNPQGKTDCAVVSRMIEIQSAPRFYISESRAVNLYYQLLKSKKNAISNSNNFYRRVFGV